MSDRRNNAKVARIRALWEAAEHRVRRAERCLTALLEARSPRQALDAIALALAVVSRESHK